MLAAEKGHVAVVQCLIKYVGADLNAKTKEGWTSLHYAAMSGSSAVINLILCHINANVTADDGATPLIAALQAVPHDRRVFALLVYHDDTSLHGQVQRGNGAMVRRLLEAGYDVNKRGRRERTPLHAFVTFEDRKPVEIAKALLASYLKPDLTIRDKNGLTPLRFTVRESRLPLVKLFLHLSLGLTRNIIAEDGFWALAAATHAFSGSRMGLDGGQRLGLSRKMHFLFTIYTFLCLPPARHTTVVVRQAFLDPLSQASSRRQN